MSSLALLTAHASLAGYGDLWMALSSGAGLALLLVWRVAGSPTALWLGLSLLAVGTQFKTEGWLWLGLGFAFIVLDKTLVVVRWQWLLLCVIATALLLISLDLTTVSLGPLGQWGIADTRVYVGLIGDYALRPYNPAIDYWRSFTHSPNFHLLAVSVMGALAVHHNKPQTKGSTLLDFAWPYRHLPDTSYSDCLITVALRNQAQPLID